MAPLVPRLNRATASPRRGDQRREKVSLALVVRDAAEKYVMGEAKREGETG